MAIATSPRSGTNLAAFLASAAVTKRADGGPHQGEQRERAAIRAPHLLGSATWLATSRPPRAFVRRARCATATAASTALEVELVAALDMRGGRTPRSRTLQDDARPRPARRFGRGLDGDFDPEAGGSGFA